MPGKNVNELRQILLYK